MKKPCSFITIDDLPEPLRSNVKSCDFENVIIAKIDIPDDDSIFIIDDEVDGNFFLAFKEDNNDQFFDRDPYSDMGAEAAEVFYQAAASKPLKWGDLLDRETLLTKNEFNELNALNVKTLQQIIKTTR